MEIRSNTVWNQGMQFVAESGGQKITMDAKVPLGKGDGMTPKELVTIGLAGCTAMDVIALMRKHKQPIEGLEVQSNATTREGGHPASFASFELVFVAKGAVDRDKLLEAVHLSQTKYCGVSATLAASAPISYRVELNGETIGTGSAQFA